MSLQGLPNWYTRHRCVQPAAETRRTEGPRRRGELESLSLSTGACMVYRRGFGLLYTLVTMTNTYKRVNNMFTIRLVIYLLNVVSLGAPLLSDETMVVVDSKTKITIELVMRCTRFTTCLISCGLFFQHMLICVMCTLSAITCLSYNINILKKIFHQKL